jgi:undecaprenyl-diphosphatase
MSSLEVFILGIIQGLTEFLPISSTGHLLLGRHAFGLKEAGLFLDTMLHIGTLIAVVYYYRQELFSIVRRPLQKLTGLLLIGTLPAVVVGLSLEPYFERISDSGVTVGWEFLATGLILWFVDGKRSGTKQMPDITYGDAFVIGSCQAVAIFPAISRSGLTIAGGLLRKLDRATAAYFSFLLSIPAISGAIVLQSRYLFQGNVGSISLWALVVGTVGSAVAGYIAVKWMIGYMKRGSLKYFAVYVWILGIIVLLAQGLGYW